MSKRSVTLAVGVDVIVTIAEVVVAVAFDMVTMAEDEDWGGGGQELFVEEERSKLGGV